MSKASGDGNAAVRQDSYGVSPSKLPHGFGLKPLAYAPVEELGRVQAATIFVVAAEEYGACQFRRMVQNRRNP